MTARRLARRAEAVEPPKETRHFRARLDRLTYSWYERASIAKRLRFWREWKPGQPRPRSD